MRANSPSVLVVLAAAIAAFAMPPRALFADTQSKREAKARREARKHEAKDHQATHHADAHPETHAKRREAEAKHLRKKSRHGEDKARHPEASIRRGDAELPPATAPPLVTRARTTIPSPAPALDLATASRVHAWVKSQQLANPATPADDSADEAPTAMPSPATTAPAAKPTAAATTTAAAEAKPVSATDPEPALLPALYNRRGRLVVPPPLKGSHEILIRQNQVADDEGLDRIRDDADLERMRLAGILVPIPTNAGTLRVDDRLPANRRYCRPWTALFLDTLARQHYARFQSPLQVNSAVRTVEFQQRLIHTNGNAAPAEGDTASPHLTGQAVDIAKHGLSLAEIAWLRGYLLPLVQQGKVDVEEEFQQSCFHISVYKKYLPRPASRRIIASSTRGMATGALATVLR